MRAQVKPNGETLSSWLVRYCEPCSQPRLGDPVVKRDNSLAPTHYIICVDIGRKGATAHIITSGSDKLDKPKWSDTQLWFWCPVEHAREHINRGN